MVHVNISVCSRVGVPAILVHVWVTQLVVTMAFGGESCFFPVDDSGCLMCI